MFLDSSVRSTLTISFRPPGRLAERRDMGLHVLGPGARLQRGGVHAQRVHGHLGDAPAVDDLPGRAGHGAAGPGDPRAQDRLAAVQERGGPPAGVEAGLVRAEHAVEHARLTSAGSIR